MINGPAGVKAHCPDCPGRTGLAALEWLIGGRMCSCCCRVWDTPKGPGHRGCSGSCKEKEDKSSFGQPHYTCASGKLLRALGQSQVAEAQIAWDFLSPSRAAGVRGKTVLAHGTCSIWKTPPPFTFSSLLLPTTQSADQLQHFYLLGMGRRLASPNSGSCSFGVCSSLLFPVATWEHVFILSSFADLAV